ncbi:FAD-dependent monooxygenase [Actinokineospora bangkokensis]|uniref:Monooxygenase n=1 Tax=Actinokineospora bangkokensis TaxID=1193682 RepID=A0A1Q9LMH9_9PSEU|nr:FAD-dependent monooxygenase [Actinokineospora bangkokensis]OLR93230.1 monooxygenase [Actinokineospora bangkokensis]
MSRPVIVVGAGPVGLLLAGELRLGGADVLVLERAPRPSGESRGLGFTARAAEVFAQRGLLRRFGDVETSPQGHFGGIPMDYSVLEGSHFGVRGIPQDRTERLLERWAVELGARVLRGHEVVGLHQDADGVVAAVAGPDGRVEFEGSHLVAADGGRSTVRGLAGFDFPGTPASREMYLADVVGRGIKPRFIGERVPGGMVMSAPLGGGVDRIIVCERGTPHRERRTAPGWSEVADAWQRLTGESLHDAEVRWVSAFTDATRQVTEYRRGRVLIAGDAAHTHLPAGGQGLSLGVQDAANLGWKLAAVVRGWAPPDLLDTYHAERHPVGARVLRNTRAQGHLYLSGEEVEPLRSVVAELIEIPEVGRHLSGMVSGLDVRYDVGPGDHPLLGRRLPGADLPTARGLATGVPAGAVAGWADRVDHRPGGPPLLVRPDGYVAWAGDGAADGLDTALRRWFGAPAPTPAAAPTETERQPA